MLVFTSCMNNYLPKARVLAGSLKNFHPDWEFCLLLGEDPPTGFNPENEPFDRILRFDQLGVPDFKAWAFQHQLVEICTAVKGFALYHFIETEKRRKVVYLDPDILVLASLAPLESLLDEYDLLLTPHQLAPQKSARSIRDNEICSLRHGVFNLGFAACAGRGDGKRFAAFWRDRLANWCRDDKDNGLFTDQKWCDLAPAYFSKLGIIRDPGYNAASWNLTDREIAKNAAGEFTANGLPLRFYHFTGHDSGMGRIMSSIYGASMPAVAELWQIYAGKLKKNGQEKLGKLGWQGGRFSNGEPISDEARLYYRENSALHTLFPDPFQTDAAGVEGFAGFWRDHQRKESNPFYVWARKPFRLATLTRLYLERHGGLKSAPKLLKKAGAILRSEGLSGLTAKIRKFKRSMGVGTPALSLSRILQSQWAPKLSEAFSGEKSVLILDHGYGGGANDYREAIIRKYLAENRPVLLLTWDFYGENLKCSFRLPDGSGANADAADLKEIAEQKQLRFGRILINELVLWSAASFRKDHYAALPYLIEQIIRLKAINAAALEIAIHDFYCVCPSYNLLEAGRNYCHIPQDEAKCLACLKASPFNVPASFSLRKWRGCWDKLFENADEIRVFSQSTRDILYRVFAPALKNIVVKPHEPLLALAPARIPDTGPMRIGIIGHIAWHKGAGIARELAALLAPDESIAVLGELEGDCPANVKVTGPYQREDLPALLAAEKITVALVPSIWPETFCYVVQECMEMNLPLAVFDLGAQGERIKNYKNGVAISEISAQAALAALRKLDAAIKTAK